jgi:membrane-bound serine protease (ClpP class)
LLAVAVILLVLSPIAGAQAERHISLLTIDGIINPTVVSYVERGIEEAEESGAVAVVIRIDTPGGLDSSTRKIVQAIDNASIPVIVYVWPQGGRAASAGTYIAMAAHVIAMAPGTTIGSATPVALGGGGSEDLPEDLRNKIVNEAASYIRAHAEVRGRNADWAEKAVREGDNLPPNEALDMNVIEIVARDLDEVLQQADGMTVTLGSGEEVTLDLENVAVRENGMNFIESFFHTVSNPDIALILLSIAILGITVEVFNPGLFFPGIIGGISLLLGFYGLGTLEASWAGIALLILGFGLIAGEAFSPGLGVLGIGGLIALGFGGFLLFSDSPPGVEISVTTMVIVLLIGVASLAFFAWKVREGQKSKGEELGYDALVGKTGEVRVPLTPEGTVFVFGERWHAHSLSGDIEAGARVVVEKAEGSDIWVRRAEGG